MVKGLGTGDWGLGIGDWEKAGEQGAGGKITNTNYQLPITNYQLPITHYPLPHLEIFQIYFDFGVGAC
ncbi:cobaltochelatase subunit CobN [Tolypothrix tenuis PCC 7101]|uniref:Cobaltochelatase subunit CobN n=1 Tax=Tolypothrix tenuis PCC 7101 TaxID=231146 RepID=A0A1Z4MXH9_9CYAN|nr:cobaltochelatase subunit CobN [Tolypothrix tenuis PCC 7101]BAZ77919.1 cobaltochelatase subunit CobN [Aulosira laxa NIES-50]